MSSVRLRRPTVEEIRQLPPTLESAVSEEFLDGNGHMSLPHYVTAASRALWRRKLCLGLDRVMEEGKTFFVVEQHARYLGEMVRGNQFSAHPRLLARSSRALHSITYVLDATRERMACSIEAVSVFVSKETRRSTDITPQLQSAIDDAIAHDAALPWAPPLCDSLWHRTTAGNSPPGQVRPTVADVTTVD